MGKPESRADYDKTTATTEVVSSHPVETRHWSQKCRRNTSRADKKNRWRTRETTCKTMKQNENNQNRKKESTPVLDNKPNGKSRLKRMLLFTAFIFADTKIN
jgi:hypothetical protein